MARIGRLEWEGWRERHLTMTDMFLSVLPLEVVVPNLLSALRLLISCGWGVLCCDCRESSKQDEIQSTSVT